MIKSYDAIGSIAVLKFRDSTLKEKKEIAKKLLEERKNIKTILEKVEKVKGKLRTIKTKFLAGKKTLETIHRESGCFFKLNIEKCYFSPRMSNDRLEIAKKISGGKVLCLFSGISPYPIIIGKYGKAEKIISIELGRDCNKYAKENVKLNKLENKISVIQGDVKKQIPKLKEKFDYIVMTRPQLKDTFLEDALKVAKQGTIIFYHGFGKELAEIEQQIIQEAENCIRKIKILESWRNGDIAPYTYRFTIMFKVEN